MDARDRQVPSDTQNGCDECVAALTLLLSHSLSVHRLILLRQNIQNNTRLPKSSIPLEMYTWHGGGGGGVRTSTLIHSTIFHFPECH